jgi:hypothetical protein
MCSVILPVSHRERACGQVPGVGIRSTADPRRCPRATHSLTLKRHLHAETAGEPLGLGVQMAFHG